MSGERIRLFVALEIPTITRDLLRALGARLRPQCRGARWSDAWSIHVTLKFIGEVAAEQRPAIEAVLAGIRGRQPFSVAFRGLGYFPNSRHPRVFWAGVEAGAELASLAADVEGVLEPLGIARESRAFGPHVTLARFKSEEGLAQLYGQVEKLGVPEFGGAAYSEFDLMQSTLLPQGARYARLARFVFADSSAESGARVHTPGATSEPAEEKALAVDGGGQ